MKNLITMKSVITLLIVFIMSLVSCKQNETSNYATTDSSSVETPAMDIHAAIITNNLEVVKQHIKLGSDINVKEPMSGSSPLISACTFNRIDIAKALIKAKADLTIQNNDGSTALHTAAFFGRIEIVQLLIDANANTTLKNNFGATPRETVLGDFAQVKPIYDMMKLQLEPMGFELDLEELEKARPIVSMMLQ